MIFIYNSYLYVPPGRSDGQLLRRRLGQGRAPRDEKKTKRMLKQIRSK